jgi:thiosulfate/3-mercaptopyruvate sulfurtransferase
MDPLVSTEWLASQLGEADLRIVDASFFLPADARNARAEYEAAHIPGAVFVDLEEIADSHHSVPNMLPPAATFASRMQALGISDADRIIVYDNSPHHSAPRLWWMLKSFGAREVAVLDGGLQKWTAEGRPVESGNASPLPRHFKADLDPEWLAEQSFVTAILHTPSHVIVDARSARRFAGEDPEPRPGVSPGHIPGSRNLPHTQLFNPDNSFKRGDALRKAFEEAAVDLGKPMVTTCGSGVTAAVLLFGAHLLGKRDVRLYDGSWAEWGSDPATEKAVGPE